MDPAIHELIRARWSPRKFEDREIPREALSSLLEAARWAPSSYNEQPWSFLIAPRRNAADFERLLSCLVPGNQAWAKGAAVLMISVARRAFDRNGRPNRHAFHDVGLAAAQMTVQATALGIAVHQMAGIDTEKARAVCGIPDTHDAVAGVALGYTAEAPGERKRRALSEFAFTATWGNPLPGGLPPASSGARRE